MISQKHFLARNILWRSMTPNHKPRPIECVPSRNLEGLWTLILNTRQWSTLYDSARQHSLLIYWPSIGKYSNCSRQSEFIFA